MVIAMMMSAFSNQVIAKIQLADLPSGNYLLDKSHANILWKVSHLGLSPYIGRFTDFDFKLKLDTKDLSNSRLNAIVDTVSISTENENFDKTLIGSSWFNTKKYPLITFNSTSFELVDETSGKLIGVLEMFGIQQNVEFDVKINGMIESHPFISNSVAIGFTANGVINRNQWEFNKFSGSVGQEVYIEISAEFTKQK